MAFGGVSELFKSSESLFLREVEDFDMGLNDSEVESTDPIVENLIGSKARSLFRPRGENLFDGGGCLLLMHSQKDISVQRDGHDLVGLPA